MILALATVWVAFDGSDARANAPRRVQNVLIVHSYHQGLQWTDSITAGLRETLDASGGEYELHFEYLDTKRMTGEAYFRRLVEFEEYKANLAGLDYDVIIVSDNNALTYIVEHRDRLYPDVPVVFCGVNNWSPALHRGQDGITGVVEQIDLAATLELMSRLHPTRDRVLVVLDQTHTGDAVMKQVTKLEPRFAARFEFRYFRDFLLEEVPNRMAALGERDLLLLLTFNRDRNGHFISYVDGIDIIRASSTVPIYGLWDFYFGRGLIGGMITAGRDQGRAAGRLALRILQGTRVDRLPVIADSPNRYRFDWNELERFGVAESDLPEGSDVINRPVPFWAEHLRLVVAIVIALALSSLAFGWRLLILRRRQRELVAANAELDRRVAEQTRELAERNRSLEARTSELEEALTQVRTLTGLLPICQHCKSIRDDAGAWTQLETYVDRHSEASFSHGICPDCLQSHYSDVFSPEEIAEILEEGGAG